MRFPSIIELQPNQVVTGVYLVHNKDIRQKKSGDPYLTLHLGDRTGELEARMWDNVADVMDTFERDDFVKVKGLLQIFQNRRQLTVHKMMRVDDREVDFRDFFPVSERDPVEMFAELANIAAGIGNPHLHALVGAVLADDGVASRLRRAPAAKSVHHAYFGGLLEHLLSMCRVGRMVASHYQNIDVDLLLTGIVLHDIGKIFELLYERSFGYTTEGQLLGHIVIGLRMVHEKAAAIADFPDRLLTLIEHMLVSHHGELEFGSPKPPMFPEALLLHHLDNLDSKMECMRTSLERDRLVEGCWTTYSAPLDRVVLKKARYMEAQTKQAADPEPTPPPDQPKPPLPHEPEPPDPNPVVEPGPETRSVVALQHNSLFAEKLQNALRKDS
jgi:3'-5' exoribonuclease